LARRYQKPDKRYSRTTHKATASALVAEEFDDDLLDADPGSITALLMGGEKPERPPDAARVAHVLTREPEPAPTIESVGAASKPEPRTHADTPGLLSRIIGFLRAVSASA
jgi:hypothetical protein